MKWTVPAAAVAALGAFGLVASRHPDKIARFVPGPVLLVPEVADAPVVDGALHEVAWRDTDARTGAFVLGAEAARPYADARFVRSGDTLTIGLYAADEDVRAGDFFRVTLGDRTVTVSARCVVRGVPVRAACDVDGTVDDPAQDEEWTVELAFAIAGAGDRVPIVVERCEAQNERCGRFGGTLVLR